MWQLVLLGWLLWSGRLMSKGWKELLRPWQNRKALLSSACKHFNCFLFWMAKKKYRRRDRTWQADASAAEAAKSEVLAKSGHKTRPRKWAQLRAAKTGLWTYFPFLSSLRLYCHGWHNQRFCGPKRGTTTQEGRGGGNDWLCNFSVRFESRELLH